MQRIVSLSLMFLVFLFNLSANPIIAQDEPALSLPFTLDWSPDGSKIASGHRDGYLAIWDTSGKNLLTLHKLMNSALPEEPLQIIKIVRWSPDGKYIAIVDQREVPFAIMRVIEAETGEMITEMETQGGFGDIEWSPDSQLLAASSYGVALFIWNVFTGEEIHQIRVPELLGIHDIDWSPDGTRIVVGGTIDNNLTIWNVETGNKLHTLIGHSEHSSYVGWSTITNQIASDSSADNTIKIWDSATGNIIFSLNEKAFFRELIWSPNSPLLALASKGNIQILDTTNEYIIQLVSIPSFTGTEDIAWSPYGGRIAYARSKPRPDIPPLPDPSENGIEIIVPLTSLEHLNVIAASCRTAPLTDLNDDSVLAVDKMQALTIADLPAFITQIKTLPPDTIPPACAADLIAVAEAIH